MAASPLNTVSQSITTMTVGSADHLRLQGKEEKVNISRGFYLNVFYLFFLIGKNYLNKF